MPTATTASQFSLTNWGPLTATFSTDAACATAGITMLGFQTALGRGWDLDCGAVPTVGASCYPSGSQLDAVASSAFESAGRRAPVAGYFSPGLVCPAGWKTVGVAARDTSISASGIFIAPTPTTTQSPGSTLNNLNTPIVNPVINAFTAALDPGETAIACCPESMTAVTDGVCVTTLPDVKPSTVCGRVIPDEDISTVTTDLTLLGQHTTAVLITVGGTAPVTSTYTGSLGPEKTGLVGVKYMPMVMLVQKAEDRAEGGGGEGGNQPPKKDNSGANLHLTPVLCISALLTWSAWILAA